MTESRVKAIILPPELMAWARAFTKTNNGALGPNVSAMVSRYIVEHDLTNLMTEIPIGHRYWAGDNGGRKQTTMVFSDEALECIAKIKKEKGTKFNLCAAVENILLNIRKTRG